MVILAALVAGLVLGLLSGGSLRALAGLHLRHAWLLFLGPLLQIVAFSSLVPEFPQRATLEPVLYYLSYAVMLVALADNMDLPPLRVLLVGTLSNLGAIVANGGYMPASPVALENAGLWRYLERLESVGTYSASRLVDEHTRLLPLCDIFAIPAGWPLATAFSVGDVLISVGAAWLVAATMHAAPASRVSTLTEAEASRLAMWSYPRY
ncbi:MAG: DUF5317 domain-containing protein [Chloroflexota bacterium]